MKKIKSLLFSLSLGILISCTPSPDSEYTCTPSPIDKVYEGASNLIVYKIKDNIWNNESAQLYGAYIYSVSDAKGCGFKLYSHQIFKVGDTLKIVN